MKRIKPCRRGQKGKENDTGQKVLCEAKLPVQHGLHASPCDELD